MLMMPTPFGVPSFASGPSCLSQRCCSGFFSVLEEGPPNISVLRGFVPIDSHVEQLQVLLNAIFPPFMWPASLSFPSAQLTEQHLLGKPILWHSANVTRPAQSITPYENLRRLRLCSHMHVNIWDCMMLANFAGIPILTRSLHMRGLLTVSKSLTRSMNTRCRSCCCSLHFSCSCLSTNIMSTVDLPARKLHCASSR